MAKAKRTNGTTKKIADDKLSKALARVSEFSKTMVCFKAEINEQTKRIEELEGQIKDMIVKKRYSSWN